MNVESYSINLKPTLMHAMLRFKPPPILNARLEKANLDFDLFLTDSAEKTLCKSQHRNFLKANKPDTPLARTRRAIQHPKLTIRLKLTNHAYTSNPVQILEISQSNLAKLYSSSQTFDPIKAETLFSRITLPSLQQEQLDLSENPITDLEVSIAIKALKPNKRPGPDGFSAAYYKNFSPILTPLLTKTFNALLLGHSFRTETLTSIISMLPKPKSDLSSWTNDLPPQLRHKTASQNNSDPTEPHYRMSDPP